MNTENNGINMTTFSKRLREARAEKKLTQKELSELSGVSTVMISAYEQADKLTGKNPALNSVYSIAAALDVSIDWLCGLSKRQSKNSQTDYLRLFIEMSIYLQPQNAFVDKRKEKLSGQCVTVRHNDADGNIVWNIPLKSNKLSKELIDGIFRVRDIIETGMATKEMIDLLVENLYLKYSSVDINEIFAYIMSYNQSEK